MDGRCHHLRMATRGNTWGRRHGPASVVSRYTEASERPLRSSQEDLHAVLDEYANFHTRLPTMVEMDNVVEEALCHNPFSSNGRRFCKVDVVVVV
eukprot:scaffold17426_cov170-Amphora_coffeaeformis.AAC.9